MGHVSSVFLNNYFILICLIYLLLSSYLLSPTSWNFVDSLRLTLLLCEMSWIRWWSSVLKICVSVLLTVTESNTNIWCLHCCYFHQQTIILELRQPVLLWLPILFFWLEVFYFYNYWLSNLLALIFDRLCCIFFWSFAFLNGYLRAHGIFEMLCYCQIESNCVMNRITSFKLHII